MDRSIADCHCLKIYEGQRVSRSGFTIGILLNYLYLKCINSLWEVVHSPFTNGMSESGREMLLDMVAV